MSTRFLVTIKGEFEETQAVIADNVEQAKEKAKRILGETISRRPVGELEILGIKELEAAVRGPQHD